MKRAVLYLRVSTVEQTTANQERELREIAGRMGCDITKVYRDHGISGAKGRDKRPQFDALCKAAARREFNTARSCRVTLPKAYQCSSRAEILPLDLGSLGMLAPKRKAYQA
jgi:hypothetical protein